MVWFLELVDVLSSTCAIREAVECSLLPSRFYGHPRLRRSKALFFFLQVISTLPGKFSPWNHPHPFPPFFLAFEFRLDFPPVFSEDAQVTDTPAFPSIN